MRNQEQIFGRLPVARKLLLIVGVFVAIVACVFYLGVLRSQILSGVRAYVGGEGLWSKAEKRAVLSLAAYAKNRDTRDYQQYLAEIAVPLGDRMARLQLQSPSPDMTLVSQGFIQGRNSPQDVADMAMLFRRFGQVGYMAKAIAIWTEGDAEIDQLRDLSEQLHQEVNSSHPSEPEIQHLVEQVAAADARITPLEDDFSSTLGEGARWINRVLSAVTLIATLVLVLLGIALSISVLNRIRNSEEKYRNLINTANDAILVIDASTRVILEANGRACDLLGMPEDELVGLHESKIYPQPKPGVRTFAGLRTGDRARGQQLELLRSDGTTVPVEVSASVAELAGRPAVLGIFRDVRDRLEAAAVLRRSEERFGYLIQNLSDLIAVVGVDGTMLYLSPSVARVAGYEPSQLVGKSFLAFVHPDDEASVRAALEQVTLKTGTATPPEFRFRHNNSSWIWLEAVASNLLNDVAVGGIVVTSRDVSRRRLLEEQVRQSQKMEAVGRLAGGIAHDFNNLLMVIRGYAEIVLQQLSEPAAVRSSIETIIRTTESAASLTRQLLSFSRKHVFNPQAVELNSLVNQMSEMLRGLLGEEMTFVVKPNPRAGFVSADPGQIEQVIMNLVVNARDAMPKGGVLTLETANTEIPATGASSSSAIPAGSYVTLSVSDTGTGMDAETQSHIFEPFFTTKSKDEGTGLGLSVVYNIVRGSGGHLRVQSELGSGSTFRVLFPRVEAPPMPEPVAPVSEASPPGTETILVAEDQPDLRWMICQFLQELGYSVLEARDGNDAVALATQYKGTIDVLLTDVVMPGMRGTEVAQQLAAQHPDMKVIYMSGYTEGAIDSANGLDATHALLQKPFELHSLSSKIREVIETHRRR
jgi:two-component system, cell cycle sensor histidine kinase and response regulator CckA